MKPSLTFLAVLLLAPIIAASPAGPDRGFVSSVPATNWEYALTSGNGKFGALVFGQPLDETIVLNHARLFMPLCEPLPPVDTASHLKEIRQMLADGRYQRAADFVVELSQKEGYGAKRWTDPFVPAFDVRVTMASNTPVENYSRSVDFATGVASVNWRDIRGGFQRQLFVSRPDDVIVLAIKGLKAGTVDCDLQLTPREPKGQGGWKAEQAFKEGVKETITSAGDGWMTFRGAFRRSWLGSLHGYEGAARVVTRGGTTRTEGGKVIVRGADEVLVLTRIELLYDYSQSQIPALKAGLEKIKPDFAALLARHAKVHGQLFNRARLDLGGGTDRKLASEQLLANSRDVRFSPALLEKEFDAARYAVICSSGELFPNLQGIWGGTYGPPWSGDFTLNGNVQSAIAADLAANLSECLLPFFDYLEAHMGEFRINAKRFYDCRGIFVPSRASTHGFKNSFDGTWPMTFWTAGAGWMAQFYYDYYLYTGDRQFLRERALPFMRETALFYEDFLIGGADGKLMFSPSYSPENHPGNSDSQTCINAAMDLGVARELLRNSIAASDALGVGKDDIRRWRALMAKLPDYQISQDGAVKEWSTPLLEDNNAHRHASHLYELFAGLPDAIATNAPLRDAFGVALENRLAVRRAEFAPGGKGPGGRPPGEMAFGIVQQGLAAASLRKGGDCGEIINWLSHHYWRPNLMTTHNPNQYFNADLCGGLPALLIRMLVDSQPGWIELLPAIPPDWPDGTIEGVRVRGQIEVRQLAWDAAKVKAVLRSEISQTIEVRFAGHANKMVKLPKGKEVTVEFSRTMQPMSIAPGKMMYADTTRRGKPWSKNPFVLKFGGRYLMYSSILPVPGSEAREIEITESRDLIHWKNVGMIRVQEPYEKNGISAPCALIKDGKVHLFYQTYGNGTNDAICHAISDDGIANFKRNPSNPIFRPDGAWNCGRAIDAEVFLHEGKYLMYYATRDPGYKIQMQGVASVPVNTGFSRDEWAHLSKDGPILKPELPWEGECIEAASIIRRNGRLYMFYAGSYDNTPQQIGVATSKDGVKWTRWSDEPFLRNGKPGEWNSSESGHPGIFDDGDRSFLFFQGNPDKGNTWWLSNVEVFWNEKGPFLKTNTQSGNLNLKSLRNPVWTAKDNLRDPSVLKTPDGYRIFYSRYSNGAWNNPTNWAIASVFTKDFVHFENDRNISPKGFASPGDVVFWQGRWLLPCQSYPASPVRLCFSESRDLSNWSAPKFFLEEAAALPWNTARRVIDPTFVEDGETLHCFFVGSGFRTNESGKNIRGNLMGHAITRDPKLEKWQILTPNAPLIGFSESAPDGVENTMIFRTGDHWTMIYSEGLQDQHLALASSPDLVSWKLEGPIEIPRQKWMSRKFGAPFVWRDGSQWLMILMGTDDQERTTFGLLTSLDGRNWVMLPSKP
ncbi:MAG: glycoside hydrolase N-terminal domain-containing protein [Verrucomicrobiota bacterium]